MNAIELSLFVSRMDAVCEEMGVVLRRTAFSPNIKDRLDFSCALFDSEGRLCAQAAHIPVHLGSMAFAMADIVSRFDWHAGDVVIVNDPFLGGTHLPDITVVAPVIVDGRLLAFAVNRAHHANIGSESPGSMPNSRTLEEEGLIIPPTLLLARGRLNPALGKVLSSIGQGRDSGGARQSGEPRLEGDIAAQVSALKTGVERCLELIGQLGGDRFLDALLALNDYGGKLADAALAVIPAGRYEFSDLMDDDGTGHEAIRIALRLDVSEQGIVTDFSGTSDQVAGNINCPLSVTAAAVYYVFRCLMPDHTPACAGIFRRISLVAPVGCLVNAQRPAAVVAGNVETSSRIVDVVLGALQQALPGVIPAASQGSMNNIAMGSHVGVAKWDYYETLAGGMGAGPKTAGPSAMHSHMTNTLNTPVESLETHYPIRIRHYAIRSGSGGAGRHRGGDGVERSYDFLAPTQVSVLSERRLNKPWGATGGEPGSVGENLLDGRRLPGKIMFTARPGQCLTIRTPGGGGWGTPEAE